MMKRMIFFTALILSMVVSHAVAADLEGSWTGTMVCSDLEEETSTVNIVYLADDIYYVDNDGFETCGIIVDGNKFYMSCDGGDTSKPSFSYGEIKGNTIYVINHVPEDGKACKGVYRKD